MDITGFTKFLDEQSSITSKDKAVRSRLSKAAKVERDLNVNLDEIVKDQQATYLLLLDIQNKMNEHNGVYQNAVRKYYEFKNNKKFPRLSHFQTTN